jgi:hypothetical protein
MLPLKYFMTYKCCSPKDQTLIFKRRKRRGVVGGLGFEKDESSYSKYDILVSYGILCHCGNFLDDISYD